MKLKDQVAVVTGAGRNIGEEIAKLFAAEGAKVAIVDVDKPRGERVVDAIRGSSGEAELFIADVSKGSDVAALVRAVVDRFGRIDILVNNVAISDNKHIFDITVRAGGSSISARPPASWAEVAPSPIRPRRAGSRI